MRNKFLLPIVVSYNRNFIRNYLKLCNTDEKESCVGSKATAKISLVAWLVFGGALFWSVILFQGMPASDIDDWDKIIMSRDVSWKDFSTSFFTPWSKSHNWVGQTDRNDEVRYKRIVLPMLLKLSQQCFGLNFFAMYFLTKGIFFAGCVTMVFLLLAQVVPLLYAISGTLVFLFVPAHYSHVLWIADTATLCYFFLFLGIWMLYAIQKNILEQGSNRQFCWLLFALLVIGWIGIRAKEPMLVLPLVVFLYSLAHFRRWKQSPVKFLALNAAMAVVAFQIIPVTHLGGGSLPSINFSLTTIGRLLFRNYACGYDNETVSAFFSWDHVFPVSVARTLGFFTLWSGALAWGTLFFRKYMLKDRGGVPFWGHPLIQTCGFWLLAEIPFLGMFQPDPRYFSGTMAPVIILCVRLFYCAIRGMSRFFRWGLIAFTLLGVGFNIYENAQNSLSVRIMIGRKLNYFWEASRIILEDMTGGKITDPLKLGKFYCSLSAYRDQPGAIKNQLFYAAGINYEGWNKVPLGRGSLEEFLVQSNKGHPYYITNNAFDLSGNLEIKQIGSIDGINHGSLLEQCLFKKKKKQPPILRILKCS